MIFHLATRRGIKAFTKHLNYRPAFNNRVRAIAYEELLTRADWPRGVYRFRANDRSPAALCGVAAREVERAP